MCNSGFSLGIWTSFSFLPLLLNVVAICFCLVYGIHLSRKDTIHLFEYISLSLMISGGLVNGLDRLVFGCVYDYFRFFGLFVWNVGDACISLGALLFLWVLLQRKEGHHKEYSI